MVFLYVFYVEIEEVSGYMSVRCVMKYGSHIPSQWKMLTAMLKIVGEAKRSSQDGLIAGGVVKIKKRRGINSPRFSICIDN